MARTIEELLSSISVGTKTAEESKADEKKEMKAEDKAEAKAEGESEKKEEKENKDNEKKDSEKKEAAQKGPMAEAMKVAEELAKMENEGLMKQAEMVGAAIFDSIIARASAYEKTASEEVSMEKVAEMIQTDPEAAASFQQGYMDKIAEIIEKDPKAKEAFTAAYEKTASEIIKIAEDIRDKAYVATAKAMNQAFSNIKK